MKTKFTIVFLLIALLPCTNSLCQMPNDKSDTLSLLLDNSKIHNKNLFLIFGWQGCGWCRLFDNYHRDTQVKEILDKYFIISKIDIYKSKAGEDLYKRFGKGGTPSWTIFDLKGKIIIDSYNGKGNVGYPANENEINHYVQALKKAAPEISKSECEILISKLKEYRFKK